MSKKTKSGKPIKMYDGDNVAFTQACERANVKPTKRQFSKWRRGFGSAWANRVA